jgi:ABC-2 type transport system permease protein
MNWYGTRTLFFKEVNRFMTVVGQTVATPVIVGVLYLFVFQHVLTGRVHVYPGVSYTQFLIPGLVMMSMIQNGFANTSTSLIQSKINGNLVFLLLAPLSAFEVFVAYIGAAMLRACLVAAALYAVSWLFVPMPVAIPWMVVVMGLMASATLAVLGLIGGIIANKFEHLSAFQNFFIVPLTFLSGVFYSINSLSPFWQQVSHFNPFFHMIDGLRHGFFGQSDGSPEASFIAVAIFLLLVSSVALWMLYKGVKLRP